MPSITLQSLEMQAGQVQNLHILIVDRDEIIQEIFAIFLLAHGYTVDAVSSPGRALEVVKKRTPDVIFTSLMFDSTSGFELCQRFREIPELADKFIVALTGYSVTGIREETKAAGFDEYLLKPVDIQVLLSLLSSVKFEKTLKKMSQTAAR